MKWCGDVNQVLRYLQELGPNAGLTQKVLTLKLAMLLALVCRARGHELRAINPQALSWYEDKVVCHTLEMTKTKSMSKPKKSFELLKHNHSSNLDPIVCLKAYLTHWGRDQIDAISQTTFSNAFLGMKMNEFRLGFHWSLFLRFELTIFQHWFR